MYRIFGNSNRKTIEKEEKISFSSFSSLHLIKVIARVKGEKQLSGTDDEDLYVKIDGKNFPIDSLGAFSGGKLHNLSETIYYLMFLKGKDHSIELITDLQPATAILEELEIYSLTPDKILLIETENQAEDGDRRPWITFVLDNISLKSFTSKITYSHRKRDSDDVKIIIDGKVQENLLTKIKNFLWWLAGSLIPAFASKTETVDFSTNFDKGLHYLEFWADRMPILHNITFNLGTQTSVPEEIPTVDNPKWTGDFYDDTETMLLARAIYGEADGEIYEAKIGVGWAIKNRTIDEKRQQIKSYHEVILRPSQYSPFSKSDPNFERITNLPLGKIKEKADWKLSYLAAEEVISGKIEDSTKGVNHFYSIIITKPYWADDQKFTIQIGKTRFYRL